MSDQARIYYNVEVSNNTSSDMEAKYDSGGLLAPLINNPQDYEVSVVRFRIPTSTIPIFPDNLPYNELQVGLDYLTTQIIEPVQQYGAVETPEYSYGWDTNTGGSHFITRYTINSDATISNETIIPIPPSYDFYDSLITGLAFYKNTLFISYKNYGLPYHYLIAVDNFDFNNYKIVDKISHRTGSDPQGVFYQCSIDIDNKLLITNVYGMDDETIGGLYFYDLTTYSFLYKYNGFRRITFARAGNTIYLVSPLLGECSLYNYARNGDVISVLSLGALQNLPSVEGSVYSYISTNGNKVFILRSTGTTSFNVYQFTVSAGVASPVITLNFTTATASSVNGLFCNDTAVFAVLGTTTENKIYHKNINTQINGPTYTTATNSYIDLDVPASSTNTNQSIFKIAEFLTVINSAYSRAYDRLKIVAPLTPTEGPPFLTFDPVSKLFSIYAPEEYSTQNLNVYMNQKLYKYFSFMAVPSNGLYNITIENYLVNNLILGSSHFIQMTQERTSLSKINQLTKIVITSSHLPIVGDVQDNSTVSYITDFTPDTTVPGELLILYPTLLRLYSLYSNREIRQVDLQIYYSTNSQDFQKLYIESGESFSVKLEFRNKNATSSY